MQGTLEARPTTVFDTLDVRHSAHRDDTSRTSTAIDTPSLAPAVSGEYVNRIVDGYAACLDFRRAAESLIASTSHEAYEQETPMVDLLRCEFSESKNAEDASQGSESTKAFRVFLDDYSFPLALAPIREIEPKGQEIEEVDWDVRIERRPMRASTDVVLVFEEGDYRPPRIIDEPDA